MAGSLALRRRREGEGLHAALGEALGERGSAAEHVERREAGRRDLEERGRRVPVAPGWSSGTTTFVPTGVFGVDRRARATVHVNSTGVGSVLPEGSVAAAVNV